MLTLAVEFSAVKLFGSDNVILALNVVSRLCLGHSEKMLCWCFPDGFVRFDDFSRRLWTWYGELCVAVNVSGA
jgi:hypothetical protein